MNKNLEKLQDFVNKMKNTSSLNEKKVIIESIKGDEFIKKALNYALDPYKKYYVTSKTCKKRSDLCDTLKMNYNDIFELLDDLNNRVYTGHDAIALVNGFVFLNKCHEDLILSIIDRNLEIRASESVINKVIPNLIPTFDVALANKFDPKRVNWDDVWLASRKLDGVRCLTIVDYQGNVKCYSRVGNEFETLQVVKDAVKKLQVVGVVFDGEICLMDKDGKEDFQGIMKQIKRKNHTITNPKYVMFDYLTLTEFNNKVSEQNLIERISRFAKLDKYIHWQDSLCVLDQIVVSDDDHFAKLKADAEKEGHEGVMLRKNVGYEGKRSQNLLKVKKFHDAEYRVERVDFEDHRVIREGKEVVIPMMAQAYISHKGYEVAVGSGWNQEQRIKYNANPDLIIGKEITVQYFEETKNQKGELSLRFPTVKHVFENGRNV
jgi:DNA ligase 1